MDLLLQAFEQIPDTRNSKGKRHSLYHVLVMFVIGILHNYQDTEDIRDYVIAHEKWFYRRLGLWDGVPSARQMDNILATVSPNVFMDAFVWWVNAVVKPQAGHVILDGKALRAAADKANGGSVPYIVSAYLADSGITLAQVKVDEKSNEITALPNVLELFSLEGCVITIDAMGTQENIMEQIIKGQGDFVLALKKNHRLAFSAVENYFSHDLNLVWEEIGMRSGDEIDLEGIGEDNYEVYVKREKAHGRETERVYIKTNNVDCLPEKFRHAKCIVMAISDCDVNGTGIRYFVSSTDESVKALAGYIRDHWKIENNLHWVLDVFFNEDRSRSKQENLMENLSAVRKMALNILKLDTRYDRLNKNGNPIRLSAKRKMNRYKNYPEEFDELIDNFLPSLGEKLHDLNK